MATPSQLALYTAAPLVRLLAELEGQVPRVSERPFAEQVSQLLNFADAAIIASAQQDAPVTPDIDEDALTTVDQAREAFAQTEKAMRRQIERSCDLHDPPRRLVCPRPRAGQTVADAPGYEAYQRYYLMMQREMDTHTRKLRARLRTLLAQGTPDQRRLAALDAAYDETLWRHARRGFAQIPARLQGHYEQLRALYREHAPEDREDPMDWIVAGAWLSRFIHTLKTALLAELAVRLQPAAGLLAAIEAQGIPHNE